MRQINLLLFLVIAFVLPGIVFADTQTGDYIKNLNAEIVKISPSIRKKPEAKLTLQTLLRDRKNEMLALAKLDPSLFLSLVMSSVDRRALPQDLQNQVEKTKSITGRVNTLHVDTVDPHYLYYLREGSKTLSFYPVIDFPLRSGIVVRAAGYQLEDSVVANLDVEDLEFSSNTSSGFNTTGPQATLVLLVDFLNSGPRPMTAADVVAETIDPNSQFVRFYEENSYNQISFVGEVRDWQRLNWDIVPGIGWGLPLAIQSGDQEIIDFLIANDIANYSRVIFLSSTPTGLGSVGEWAIDIAGQQHLASFSFLGVSDWVHETTDFGSPLNIFSRALVHEFGHNLGLPHAAGWDCAGLILYNSPCDVITYGNVFDVMGTGSSGHFNGISKLLLSWINNDDILTITESGNYTVKSLEFGPGLKIAKVLLNSGTLNSRPLYLVVEYRRPVGFDALLNHPNYAGNLNGLFVSLIQQWSSGDYGTYLLDMKPQDQVAWTTDVKNSSLDVGETFIDEYRKIQITPLSLNDDEITFNVQFLDPRPQAFGFLYPLGGEHWTNPSQQLIRWNTQDVPPDADITFKTTFGTFPLGKNDGAESINVSVANPAPLGYLSSLTASYNNLLWDDEGYPRVFVDPFNSSPLTISVLNPNGGEKWFLGNTKSVSWSVGNGTGNEDFSLSVRNPQSGAIFNLASGLTSQNYSWLVGRTTDSSQVVPVGDYFMKVCTGGGVCDESDQAFRISAIRGGGGGLLQPSAPDHELSDETASIFDSLRFYIQELIP